MENRHRSLEEIAEMMKAEMKAGLKKSGIMHHLFARVKSPESIRHKMGLKGEKYRSGAARIQDILGFRIVFYFPDDVDIMADHLSLMDILDSSVDRPDVCTFSPKRLNLTMRIPEEYIEDFRAGLPQEYARYIDDAYELQLRTVYSEGWHEVEHDLRYKCKEDWIGYEKYSRTLNGVIATLETAEYTMMAIFNELSEKNLQDGNFRSMIRNRFRLRITSEDFSPEVREYLVNHSDIVKEIYHSDRMVFILTLLNHKEPIPLTYDNIIFLLNRIFLKNEELIALESTGTKEKLESFFHS